MTRRTVPTAAAAIALGITESGVRKLAQRSRLTRYGTRRRAEYDVEELMALRDDQDTEIVDLPRDAVSR
jgi:hypothetical protein